MAGSGGDWEVMMLAEELDKREREKEREENARRHHYSTTLRELEEVSYHWVLYVLKSCSIKHNFDISDEISERNWSPKIMTVFIVSDSYCAAIRQILIIFARCAFRNTYVPVFLLSDLTVPTLQESDTPQREDSLDEYSNIDDSNSSSTTHLLSQSLSDPSQRSLETSFTEQSSRPVRSRQQRGGSVGEPVRINLHKISSSQQTRKF